MLRIICQTHESIAELMWVMDQISSHFVVHLSPSARLSFNSSLSSLRLLFSAFLSLVSPSSDFPHQFFPLLLQNFLHKEHSLGCVIPPSHTSSFPPILLSDEGRSSRPFPLFPYVFSALLPPHFPSLSFSLLVFLFVSIYVV